jgi:hypothetical protein
MGHPGFIFSVWGLALALIFMLSPDVFAQYPQANVATYPYMVTQTGGFILSAFWTFGPEGVFMWASPTKNTQIIKNVEIILKNYAF